ncbi:MAG: alkaline phosphatase [Deltaproteobacteria bacterium]|nr:alkaline phosphatase [Deltaproteobacteria bacterium]
MKKKTLFLLPVLTAVLGAYLASNPPWPGQTEAASSPVPKYIFIFLADGAGITHMEITRQYNRTIHNEGLTIVDRILKEGFLGLLTTHPADSLSTDSAAAATALACGCKAKNGMIGICEDGHVPKTVMEIAREKGMRIGLVTNSTVYDASPAAFVSHLSNRRLYSSIIDQYLRLEPEVLLGGGRDRFLPQSQTGSRRNDEIDMIVSFQKRGYSYVSTRKELAETSGPKVLGLFSLQEMSFEIDRNKELEPSIYDMTDAAIRILQQGNRNGFMLFLETENVDSAAHLTDAASLIRDFREFDRAVALAYEFYRRHPRETLILVTSDHETGGLAFTLALKDLSSKAGKNQVAGTEKDLKKIQSISISLKKAGEILGPNPTPESIDRLMKDHFKEFSIAPEFKKAILEKTLISRTIFSDPTANALGMIVANNTQGYWLTTAHTNHPVFVGAMGVGAEKFRGYQDNTDFARHLKVLLGEKPS